MTASTSSTSEPRPEIPEHVASLMDLIARMTAESIREVEAARSEAKSAKEPREE